MRAEAAAALVPLLAAVLPAPGGAEEVDRARFSRQVEVETAGPVRVELDFDALRHMAPGGADLAVSTAEGLELPRTVRTSEADSPSHSARVTDVTRGDGGWWIYLEAGTEPRTHRRLTFEFSARTLAPGVALESSAEGSRWTRLAEVDLFQLGADGGLARNRLEYAPTSDRWLRLWWPQEAGFPEAVAVRLAGRSRLAVEQEWSEDCRELSSRLTACRIEPQAPAPRRLWVELNGSGRTGYRLAAASGGTWTTLAAGEWRFTGSGRYRRSLPLDDVAAPALRLELSRAAGGGGVELWSHSVEYAALEVRFVAPAAGTYTLTYGSGRRAQAGAAPPPEEGWERAARLLPGPESAERRVPLPEVVTGPGKPLPAAGIDAAWRLEGPKPGNAGQVVRAALTPDVLATQDGDLRGLRLAAGERQLPFFVDQPEEPRALFEQRRLEPSPRTGGGSSVLRVELLPFDVTQVELSAFGGPFERPVVGRFVRSGRPGAVDDPVVLFRQTWHCEDGALSPCRLAASIPRAASRESRRGALEIELTDGDNPPLGEVYVSVWLRGRDAVFIWPGSEVRLLATAAPALPTYDLELLRREVLRQPWVEAVLVPESGTALSGPTERWERLLLIAALVATGLLLIVYLARILRRIE